ncbi:DUF2306 domain-containing protein [Actinoplanes teichomyceticus]|uniref:Putative membrane protein DUF2306 n=1 Tax=Actinoplanes teichomyceticus TaxID=1867 RepID=A0A561WAK2_ACTTI|nr:DUF2306 domain-containing protein [Actinoplanes teichomyceticus]TWG20888.1 putative membrane protein DUF2306 [Actinoplanes teichomyceticus]GIF16475.1 hypothetical protein Ate01nite_65070 [Actinoplanes teichomyceticus]
MTLSTDGPIDLGMTSNDVGGEPKKRQNNRRPRSRGLGMLTFVVLAWLAVFVAPVYFSLDPSTARIPLRPGLSLHYPLLVVHVWSGTVAMLTGLMQMWPWLRRAHPRVHRVAGRVYVVAVVAGAPALAALIAIRSQTLGDVSTAVVVGFGVQTVLWVWVTATGYRRARQRRWADHRRLMIYSFALTLSIIWSRIAFVVAMMIPGADMRWVSENTGWFPWVLDLLIAHWWISRTQRRPLQLSAATQDEKVTV